LMSYWQMPLIIFILKFPFKTYMLFFKT